MKLKKIMDVTKYIILYIVATSVVSMIVTSLYYFGLSLIFGGDYNLQDDEIWICNEPYSQMYQTDEDKELGKICTEEKEYPVIYNIRRSTVYVYEQTEKTEDFEKDNMKYCLFKGKIKYKVGKMNIRVDIDYKDIFKGEYPVLSFKKYKKADVFKENIQ